MKTCLLLLVLIVLVPIHAGDAPPNIEGRGEWGPETLGLRCRVTTDKSAYKIGESVRVLVEVQNMTDKSVALGLEPLLQIGKKNQFSRQLAELHLSFSQGSDGKLGFFSTHHITFPRGLKSEARALVVEPKGTFTEVVTVTPWGPTLSSDPSEPVPGRMTLNASLWQFLSPDLKRTQVSVRSIAFDINSKME
jgi:hypothetical protein